MALHTSTTVRAPWTNTAPPGPVSINTFSFSTEEAVVGPALLTPLHGAIADLWSTGLAPYLGSIFTGDLTVSSSGADADPPGPTPAILETSHTFTPNAVGTAPPDIAMLVGFRAPYESGVSKRRFRGRQFLGPLAFDTTTFTTTGRLDPDAVDAVGQAFADFAAAVRDDTAFTWVCGSLTYGRKAVTRVEVNDEPARLSSRRQGPAHHDVETLSWA